MKYEVNNLEQSGISLFDINDVKGRLITIGDINLMKEDDKKYCYCVQSGYFNYHGMNNPLCSKTVKHYPPKLDEYFCPSRIIIIQMI